MKKNYNSSPASWIIPIGLVVLFAIVFLGCKPEARQLRKTQEYLFRHPEFSAGYCAEQFPVKEDSVVIRDSIHFDTLYKENLVTDTIVQNGDTVYRDRVIPANTIVKTIYKDKIIYQRDYAQEKVLQLALDAAHGNITIMLAKQQSLEQQVNSWKGKAKKRWWWIALLIGGAAAYTGFRIYGKFKKPKISVMENFYRNTKA